MVISRLLGRFRRPATALDPVCGMTVSTRDPGGGTFVFEDTTYYFCDRGCRLEFEEDPRGYLSGKKQMQM